MAERERARGERGNRACWAGARGMGRREKGKGEEAGRCGEKKKKKIKRADWADLGRLG